MTREGSGPVVLAIDAAGLACSAVVAVGDTILSAERVETRHSQSEALMPMVTSGYPDYSEVFDFSWSGKYQLRVLIQRKAGAKSTEADFTINHVI